MIGLTRFSRGGRGGNQLIAEINITPFTDVVLVLLIVFMVSASALGTGKTPKPALNVNLPAAQAAESVSRQDAEITIRADGAVYLGRDRISVRDLPGALRTKVTPSDLVIIQADERVRYDRIVNVMDAVKQAGLDKIALATKEKGR